VKRHGAGQGNDSLLGHVVHHHVDKLVEPSQRAHELLVVPHQNPHAGADALVHKLCSARPVAEQQGTLASRIHPYVPRGSNREVPTASVAIDLCRVPARIEVGTHSPTMEAPGMAAHWRSAKDLPKAFSEVTSLLTAACAELAPGELIVAPGFALGEAMNVVELLHPRMDAGMRKTLPVDDIVARHVGSGSLRFDLSVEETRALWDSLFQQLVRRHSHRGVFVGGSMCVRAVLPAGWEHYCGDHLLLSLPAQARPRSAPQTSSPPSRVRRRALGLAVRLVSHST
jgi:hypothetical protein